MTNFGKELIQSAREALAMVDIAALPVESAQYGYTKDITDEELEGFFMDDQIGVLAIGTITIQGTDADIKRMLREFWGVIGVDANAQT